MLSLVILAGIIAIFQSVVCHSHDTVAALILEHKWAVYRVHPKFNIHLDPIRKTLKHGTPPAPPSSCHYYLIQKSFENGPLSKSIICVEFSHPSLCNGKNGKHFSLMSHKGRGTWTAIGHHNKCSCDLYQGNYIFI